MIGNKSTMRYEGRVRWYICGEVWKRIEGKFGRKKGTKWNVRNWKIWKLLRKIWWASHKARRWKFWKRGDKNPQALKNETKTIFFFLSLTDFWRSKSRHFTEPGQRKPKQAEKQGEMKISHQANCEGKKRTGNGKDKIKILELEDHRNGRNEFPLRT